MSDSYVKVMVSCIIWGTIGVFARWSGGDPLSIAFFRCFIAAVVLYIYLYRYKHRISIPGLKCFLLVCAGGLFNAAGNFFYFTAIELSTLSHALFVYYLGPVLMVVLAPLFLKERFETKSLLSLLIAAGGMLLIVFSAQEAVSPSEVKGLFHALAGAVCFSGMFMIAKVLPMISGITMAFLQMLIASFCLLPFLKLPGTVSAGGVACMVVLGVVHTAVGYSTYYEGLRRIKIQHAGILLYLDPVVATIMGYVVFQEAVRLCGFFGGMLIVLAGTIIITGAGGQTDNRRTIF